MKDGSKEISRPPTSGTAVPLRDPREYYDDWDDPKADAAYADLLPEPNRKKRPEDKRRERSDRLLGAGLCGLAAATGALILLFAGADAPKALPDRQAAALLLLALAAMILSGAPAGWAASPKGPGARTMAAAAGAYLALMIAWFAGLEPSWPACLAWAWGLSFAGSWVGLGLAALLGRRKAE